MLADPLKLIAGVRFSTWKTNYFYLYDSPEGGFDYDYEKTLPYAGLIYDFSREFSAFASFTEIFKPQNSRDVTGRSSIPSTAAATRSASRASTSTAASRLASAHPDRAGEHRRLVAEDVAEHVLGDDHVEVTRGGDELHRGVVDERVPELDVRELLGMHAAHDLAPRPSSSRARSPCPGHARARGP